MGQVDDALGDLFYETKEELEDEIDRRVRERVIKSVVAGRFLTRHGGRVVAPAHHSAAIGRFHPARLRSLEQA